MLKKYSLKALQIAMNQAIMRDENVLSTLYVLNGKTLEIIISPLNVNFFIHFNESKIQLLDHYDEKADTIIYSNPLGLIRLSLLPASKARSLFNDKIRMTGDVELGQHVKKLFDEIEIDWEGHLAHFTGDVVAYQIGSIMRKGMAFTRHVEQSVRQNMTEYLQEELRVLPSKYELEDFFAEIDELSLTVERLQAHVNQLLSRYEIN